MPFETEQWISNDERPRHSEHDTNRHGKPERDIPADQHYRCGVGTNPNILGLAQINLTAVSTNRVPAHAIKGKHEELDHRCHGKR